MKRKVVFILLLLVTFFLSSFKANCQEQAPMSAIWINEVPLSAKEKYEAIIKKQVQLLTKYEYNYPFLVFRTSDNYYYWISPLESLNTLDELYDEWGSLIKQMEQNDGFNHKKEFENTTNYVKPVINIVAKELSYHPESSRFDYSKPHYVRWHFVNVYYGKDDDFLKKHYRYTEEFKKHKVISGFETYIGSIGCETPYYIWMERYKNPKDLIETREKIFDELGPEAIKIWKEMQKDIRKYELKTGWYRADLSYIPKE